jgi:YHS domain-containing protein
MAAVNSLLDRLDAEFAAANERARSYKTQQVEAFQGQQQRLDRLETVLEPLREIWRPRLEALAQKFGERVDVRPNVEPGRRSASFEFQSDLARIDLRFGVMPDPEVKNVVFTYDLRIIPILMRFESHDEIEFPLDDVDTTALAKWIDDRIVNFVKTYLSLHENEYYLKDHMVQDPVAKVKFPRYAAGATLEAGGKTHYFIDESTRREFQQQQQAKK